MNKEKFLQYNTEDLVLLNMKTRKEYASNSRSRSGFEVYKIEDELTLEEKLEFLDDMNDGLASYMLDIIRRWDSEKDTLPKDSYGSPKTVSKKAWLRKNDPRKIIDNDYKIGKYYLFGNQFTMLSEECPNTEYGYNELYTGKNVVHQWFHDYCNQLYIQEKKYFKETNQTQIKLSKVKEYGNRYGVLVDSDINRNLNDIIWNGLEDVTEKEVNLYLEAYEKIDKYIKEISKELESQL